MTPTETMGTPIEIANYGPWTRAASPIRETDQLTVQSRPSVALPQLVDQDDGCEFATRFGTVIGITDGLVLTGYRLVRDAIRNRYPVAASFDAWPSPRKRTGKHSRPFEHPRAPGRPPTPEWLQRKTSSAVGRTARTSRSMPSARRA
uniref:GTP cyclohydrolase IIa n=1 Tax=Natrinema halophilum TaxID=1699371 RepID=A0A7D5K7F3_9EURY